MLRSRTKYQSKQSAEQGLQKRHVRAIRACGFAKLSASVPFAAKITANLRVGRAIIFYQAPDQNAGSFIICLVKDLPLLTPTA